MPDFRMHACALLAVLLVASACGAGASEVEVDAGGNVAPTTSPLEVQSVVMPAGPASYGVADEFGSGCESGTDPHVHQLVEADKVDEIKDLVAVGDRSQLLEPDSAGRSALFKAAKKGKADALAALVDSGIFDIEERDSFGATLLLTAAAAGCEGCVERLIAAGSDVAAVDARGRGAVRSALAAGSPALAEWLLSAGAPFADASRDSLVCMLAARDDVPGIRWAVAHGATVDEPCNAIEQTPLSLAAQSGASDAVEFFTNRGVRIDAPDAAGMTALHWAASRGRADAALLLLSRGANATAKTAVGFTPAAIAARNGHANVETLIARHLVVLERRRAQAEARAA